MSGFKRFLMVILVILTAVALVAGCGGGQQVQQEEQKPAAQPAKPKLVVASDTAYAPFEYLDTSTGQYVGFDMDLIQAIAEELGYEPDIRSMSFDGVLGAVATSQVDCAISAITITDERLQKMNFSKAYY